MANSRFLIGGGENLSESAVRPLRRPSEKVYQYSVSDRQRELAPQWERLQKSVDNLPSGACPNDNAVFSLTLHPSFLARSHYPQAFISLENLKPIGSRLVTVRPKKPRPVPGSKGGAFRDVESTAQLFLEVSRDRISDIAKDVMQLPEVKDMEIEQIEGSRWLLAAQDYRKIESISALGEERLKAIPDEYRKKGCQVPIEAILHAGSENDGNIIRRGFIRYARELGIDVTDNRLRVAGGLTFIPFYASFEILDQLSKFSYLRSLRKVPRLARLTPVKRSLGSVDSIKLPDISVAHDGLKVAIFDGGLPRNHGLEKWVSYYKPPGIGAPDPDSLEHGVQVTSAFLFGHLSQKHDVPTPLAKVDHIRVLDKESASDDFQLYTILERIERFLRNKRYDFVNISLGPSQAMIEDDIDPWTVMLDQIFADGKTVCSVACGNDGHLDHAAKLNRIQPPSDGVNILGVGAADSPEAAWKRAYYSCIGPGRSPGLVKPDLVAFGGTEERPFLAWVGSGEAKGTAGTSFAAPLALRTAAGIRAQFDVDLWAPTVKALLVHHADPRLGPKKKAGSHPVTEVGWGRITHNLEEVVLCDDGEARVIYQVELPPRTGKRLYLPVPPDLPGQVQLSTTICYYTDVDPEDSAHYTRLGLDVIFRPHINNFATYNGKQSTVPKRGEFFGKLGPSAEVELRDDAQKWETIRHAVKMPYAKSLQNPFFDIFCIARENGQQSDRKSTIKLGAVISVKCSSVSDLYDRVLRTYSGRLQPLRLRNQAPIKIRQ